MVDKSASDAMRAAIKAEQVHALGIRAARQHAMADHAALQGAGLTVDFQKQMARTAYGPGPPEAIWEFYRAEIGPLAAMDDDCLRELFAVHRQRAWGADVSELILPPEIEARLVDGEPPRRGRGKPARSFLIRRWEKVAMDAVRARQAKLKAAAIDAEEALDVALAAVVQPDWWPIATIKDWIEHPGRRQKPRVRPRRN
jgi:hypothetical protein